ncbi:MAG: hypothetical protein MKZ71_03195 [Acidimicrobiales bacterium]|nr:hypothetical protein [Acidimicrobiales bacterium]
MAHKHHASGMIRQYRTSHPCISCHTSVHWDGTLKAYISDEDLSEDCEKSLVGHNC